VYIDFYTGSLKMELHSVNQGNLSMTLHYFKRFTQSTKITFLKIQNN